MLRIKLGHFIAERPASPAPEGWHARCRWKGGRMKSRPASHRKCQPVGVRCMRLFGIFFDRGILRSLSSIWFIDLENCRVLARDSYIRSAPHFEVVGASLLSNRSICDVFSNYVSLGIFLNNNVVFRLAVATNSEKENNE